MAEKITYSTQSYTPFKLKSGNTTSFKLMGSSAVKFLGGLFGGGGGGGGIFGRIRDRMQKGNMAETQSMNAGAAAEGGGGGGVPPHGPEAHTGGGGAIGGAPQERGGGLGQSFMGGGGGGGGVWNVGNAMGEMEGMDRMGRREYMGGLDQQQQLRIRKQERMNKRGKSGLGGFLGGRNTFQSSNFKFT